MAKLRDMCVICDICGEEFTPKSSNHKRCSPKCSQEAIDRNYKRGPWLIFDRDCFQCVYCGKTSYADGVRLHVDHIVPRKENGEDTASNLVTSCSKCNLGKASNKLSNEAVIIEEVANRNRIHNIHPEAQIKLSGY